MNEQTRKELNKMLERLEEIAGVEREKAENMADYFEGEKVEMLEEIADYLDEAVENIKEATAR